MHWISFSWGAFASLVLFVIVDGAQRTYQSELHKRGDPFDWINAKQFREMLAAADARYLTLHVRHLKLRRVVEKLFRTVESNTPTTISEAADEVEAALKDEPDTKGPWPGQS